MKFLIWLVVNAGALAVATWLLDGMRLTGSSDTDRILTLLIVALIFGVINAVLGPVIKLLSLPFIILTLGLLLLVINALLLMLTSAICGALDVPFQVDGFGTAVLGSIIITIASWILEAVLPDGD
ncbi:MAG TPA: phage holin family protein [Nocardioidaceae bacterium]|nr:phage holin family protein [Nocardioidaceae bacterium]HET8718320.1 phage holin family protein [Nocardioidaceae bacterium]